MSMQVRLLVSAVALKLFSSKNDMIKRGAGNNFRIRFRKGELSLKPSSRRTEVFTEGGEDELYGVNVRDGKSEPFTAPDKLPLGRFKYVEHPVYKRGWLLLTPARDGVLTLELVKRSEKKARKAKGEVIAAPSTEAPKGNEPTSEAMSATM